MSNPDQTLYEWLQTQTPEFQNIAIGEKYAGQLRTGDLDSKRFTTLKLGKRFKPMSLEQMKEIEDNEGE